jgi:transposase-like protein
MSPSIRSPFNRPRWTERDARAALTALERSGKPVSVFAKEHGLDPQRLYAWRRRVAGGDGTMFREVIVRPSDEQRRVS